MILKIGTGNNTYIDVSAYVESGYRVDKQSLYSNDYTAVNGAEHQTYLGCKYSISATLGNVPASVAANVCQALKVDGLSIMFSFPETITATFYAPEVNSTLITEGDISSSSGELWDIEISAISAPQLNSL